MRFDTGVKSYVKGFAVLTVFFPVNDKGVADICCKQCKYYKYYTNRCLLTDDVIAYPDHYVGQFCPLEIVENTEENKNETN